MLTELQVKTAKPKEKYYMLRDDRSLYLRVDTSGKKYWIFRYSENKKARQLSLGAYPDISLKDARLKRDELLAKRAKGQSSSRSKDPQTLSEITSEWLKIRMQNKDEGYLKTIKLRLNKYILPEIGTMPLTEISSRDIYFIIMPENRKSRLHRDGTKSESHNRPSFPLRNRRRLCRK